VGKLYVVDILLVTTVLFAVAMLAAGSIIVVLPRLQFKAHPWEQQKLAGVYKVDVKTSFK
jgi:hypothetical protein